MHLAAINGHGDCVTQMYSAMARVASTTPSDTHWITTAGPRWHEHTANGRWHDHTAQHRRLHMPEYMMLQYKLNEQ